VLFRLKYLVFIFFILKSGIGFSQLVADFSASVTSGCLPLPVSFRDLSTGNPDRMLWEFGDGRTSDLKNPGVAYLLPGSYTIKLTIYKGTDSAVQIKPNHINVYEYPEIDFRANILSGCSPLPVIFTDLTTPGSGTISNYKWDFGDGNSGNTKNPMHTYRVSGRYNVTLTATNSFGCVKSATIPNYIRIYDSVKADFQTTVLPACGAPFTVIFKDTSTGAGLTSHAWKFGDGKTSTEQNPAHDYSTPGIYNVQLIVKNASGCSDTISKSVNIIVGNFQASFTAPDSVCRGPVVNFTNTSVPLALADSVLWDFGDGTFSKVKSPPKSFASTGLFNVKLTVFFRGCQVSFSKAIKILGGPNTEFEGNPREACNPPLNVRFTNKTIGGSVVRWIYGNGNGSNSTNPLTSYNTTGNFNVTLITLNALGCFDTLTRNNYIRIQPPNISSINGLPFQGCFPWTNTFRANVSTSYPVISYQWDFGDGTGSVEPEPQKTYSIRGSYKVRLIVTTESGCADTIYSTVKGGLKPQPEFTADPRFVCPSDLVKFDGIVKGLYDSLRWEFGDGGKAYNILDPAYVYKDTGWMNVSFYSYDNGCVDSIIKLNYIFVTPPYALFNFSTDCANPYKYSFRDSSVGAIFYNWDFGDGSSSTDRNPVHNFTSPGKYQVKLTVSDGNCTHSRSYEVHVIDEKPDFIIEENKTCERNIIRFIANGPGLNLSNIQKFEWRFSDGVNNFNANSVFQRTFTQFVNLQARLWITDLNGCIKQTSKPLQVTLGGPKARILPVTQVTCLGNQIVFADTSVRSANSPIQSWTWNFGDGRGDTTFLAPPFRVTYKDTGYYDITLKVKDVNGCRDSITVKRAVGVFNPSANFISNDTIICPNTNVRFLNLSKGVGLKYLWNLGENDQSSSIEPVKKFPLPGLYDISLQVTDTAGCKSTLLRPKYINVGGARARFELSDSFASCPPLFVSFTNKSVGAVQSSWNFGNGNTSLLTDPVQTFNQIGVFNVKLFVTGNGGCIDSLDKQVVIRGPQGEITYGPLSGCPPLEVNFKSTSTNVKSYIWDYSDGNTEFGTDSIAKHTYLNPGTYRPRVILEDGQNCRIPILGKQEIKIVGVRSLIKQLKSYIFCDSATIAFGDSSITNDAIRRWHWDFGDGDTSNLQNPVHTFKTPGKFKVSLLVETFDNCNNIYVLPNEIFISSSPKLTNLKDTSFCLPGKVLFRSKQESQNPGVLTWNWNFGNGIQSDLSEPDTVLYDRVGVYRPKVVVTNENGCSDSVSARVTVYESAETYIVNIGKYQFCNAATIAFKDSSTNAAIIDRWLWDFGDGTTSEQRNPVHIYDRPGRYTASLSVFTDRNCVTTQILSGQIVIAPTPEIDILFDSAKCLPAKIGFTSAWLNSDSSTISYNWNFGNGQSSSKRIPDSVIYSNYGSYNIQLNASNEYGCVDSVNKLLRINDLPKAIAGGINPGALCDSGIINFNGSVISNDPISSWAWNFGDGGTSSEINPSHLFNTPGNYKVSLTVNSIYNCSSTGTFNSDIVVTASPKIRIDGTSEICIPDSARFTATWLNADNRQMEWNWRFGNGSVSSRQNPDRVLYKTPGNYTIEAIVRDLNGCRDSLTMQLVARDSPRLVVTGADITCLGTGVNLTASGAESYKWEPAVSLSCTDCASTVATPSTKTTYTVTGSNGTLAGCQRQKSVTVDVIPPFNVLAVRGDSICIGESYQLLASGGTTFSWSPATGLSATNVPNPVARPQQTITYRVVATDLNNCYRDTAYVPVVVFPKPEVRVKEKIIKGFVGANIAIQTEAQNVTRWRWSPSVGLSCVLCPEPQLTISQPAKYKVFVTNPGGCEAVDEVIIEPICATDQVFIPNTFSPNGDGRNDLFYPLGRGISAIKSLKVFNRWGEVVFEKNNFTANDPSAGWNGTYKGRILSPDVFVYVMVVLCYNNQTVEMKGNVTLLQ
jgi:gliding motility-associated-like protein